MNPLTPLAKGRRAELVAWEEGRVVKLFPPGYASHAIEAELRHARSAHALGIPTPRAEGIIGIDGRDGILFERVEGPTLLDVIVAGALPAQRLAQLFFDLQRAIHRTPDAPFPDMRPRLAIRIAHAPRVSESVKRAALDALERLPAGRSACHGDFHPANVIMAARGPMVVDWLDAGLADPTLDAARSLLLLRFARPGKVPAAVRAAFVAAYAGCLRQAWAGSVELIERWQLPVAVARLAETTDETERESLVNLISTR